MPSVARMTDMISGDRGASPTPISTLTIANVKACGQPVAVVGSKGAAHGNPPSHPIMTPTIIAGSGTVFAGGLPIARLGDPCDCGAVVQTGAATVIAN